MANLVRLTVTESNKLTNIGSYSFNAARIKRVIASSTGSLIYYSGGCDKQSGLIKIKVSEAPSVINAYLTGSLDIQISVNVLSIDGQSTVRSESVRVSDIIYAQINSGTVTYTNLWLDTINGRSEYKVNDTLSSLEVSANADSISTINTGLSLVTVPDALSLATGSNAINLSNVAGQEYNVYDMASGALTLTVGVLPVRGGSAYGIIKSDATNQPTVSAFTVLTGSYDNTNDVLNHWFASYRYNESGVLTAYLQWVQPV